MDVIINGEKRQFAESIPLTALVEQLGMQPERLAIELNGDIVPRPLWPQTLLHDRDRLEIVHFVGGGKARHRVIG
jgi:thiamine biosynthesis protein ThiS